MVMLILLFYSIFFFKKTLPEGDVSRTVFAKDPVVEGLQD